MATRTLAHLAASVVPFTIGLVFVTVVRRTNNLNDIVVSISPKGSYDNLTTSTAVRVNDLINASAVAEGSKTLDYECQGIVTDKNALADIIWTVDISRSMDGNQVRLANTANAFFNRLRQSGVDFRVGVFNAFSPATVVPNLATTTYACFPNGFKFIQGTSTMGDRDLCRQVTSTEAGANGYCPLDVPKTNDTCAPFGFPDGGDANEEPVAAAVLVNDKFVTNAASMNQNADWKWRPGATKVAFMVTDEPGTNDFGRYFQTANIPGMTPATRFAPGGTYNAAALTNMVNYFKMNDVLTYGAVPLDNATVTLQRP